MREAPEVPAAPAPKVDEVSVDVDTEPVGVDRVVVSVACSYFLLVSSILTSTAGASSPSVGTAVGTFLGPDLFATFDLREASLCMLGDPAL